MATLNNVLKAIEALKTTQESNAILTDSSARYMNKLFLFCLITIGGTKEIGR